MNKTNVEILDELIEELLKEFPRAKNPGIKAQLSGEIRMAICDREILKRQEKRNARLGDGLDDGLPGIFRVKKPVSL